MTFRDLGLSAPILRALEEQGYAKPSPIQEKAIPPALRGRDVLGCAQTGTGKTCAFAAPILQRLEASRDRQGPIRALILTPTRELALQIGESFSAYGKYLGLRHTVIFGGVGQAPQVEALKRGVDILVATPGRLMDLHDQGLLSADRLEIFVLDEADRMLDMGFIHDVKKILKWLPQKKQTLFFSATMPPEITDLVHSLLKDPVKVAVDPVSSPVEAIRQSVYFVDRGNKTQLLAHLVEELGVKNALVFTRTKHGANKVARDLGKAGITAAAIHGNKSQTARQQALSDFKAGRVQCLVATDIAARGLDIEELSHVFNYNLPEVPETYVHRIGRTGRAGREGVAVALCDFSEKPLLKEIEKLMGRKIPVVGDHPWPMEVFEAPKRDKNGKVLNEDDMEARAAARELRRMRDQNQKEAIQQKAAQAQQLGQEEGVREEKSRSRRRSRKKSAPAAAVPSAAPEQPCETPVCRHEPPKRGVRPGTLMDTGDAMPRTEFFRPNPLDSDVIMDATARLLAPRRGSPAADRSGGFQREEEGKSRERRSGKPRRSTSDSAAQQNQTRQKKSEKSSGRREEQHGAKVPPPKAAPAKERTGKEKTAEGKKRSGRSGGRRNQPAEPRRSGQPKDSTEQHSLMKPYYLDIDR